MWLTDSSIFLSQGNGRLFSTGRFSHSLITVINMQIAKGQLLGGKAFYFDFKWTSYAIMKMQITLSCRWNTVFPAAAGPGPSSAVMSTVPGGFLLISKQRRGRL